MLYMDDRRSNQMFASRLPGETSVSVGSDVMGLTLQGNQSVQHAHRRLMVLAQREYGISLRDINSASPPLTLLLPDDSLFACFASFYQTDASPASRPASGNVNPPPPVSICPPIPPTCWTRLGCIRTAVGNHRPTCPPRPACRCRGRQGVWRRVCPPHHQCLGNLYRA